MPRVITTGTFRRHLPGPTMALAALTVSTTLAVTGCADPGPTPEQLRRDRVEARLGQSFTAPQSACILRRADDTLLVALDRKRDLAPGSPEADAYSEVVVDCVSDPDSPPSTPSTTGAAPGPVDSTGADDGTSTTGGAPR